MSGNNNAIDLETVVSDLRNKNAQLENKVRSLTATINSAPSPPKPFKVVIKSVWFRDRYVCMNGGGVKSFRQGGGGHVRVQKFIGGWETFELVRHEECNVVSFKSTCFDNVYLRADVQGMVAGAFRPQGAGLVNCQYGCGNMERFRLVSVGNQGELAIEPADFPGRYFRVNGNWLDGMNMQGTVQGFEKFWLVIVP